MQKNKQLNPFNGLNGMTFRRICVIKSRVQLRSNNLRNLFWRLSSKDWLFAFTVTVSLLILKRILFSWRVYVHVFVVKLNLFQKSILFLSLTSEKVYLGVFSS